MRLASLRNPKGHEFVGLAGDDGVIDVTARLGVVDLKDWLAPDRLSQLASLVEEAPDHGFDAVGYRPVIPTPGKIILVGTNYESARRGQGRPKLQYPLLSVRFTDTLVGHAEPLVRPAVSREFDYEGELAVIIGRPAHRVSAADAWDHIAGYACFNDGTARDWMRHARHFVGGKNFPRTAGFGPWLLTRDALPDLAAASIETRVNGDLRQKDNLGAFTFSIPELIEYITTFTPLDPGDVIATGSPAGSGFKLNPPSFLSAGDEVSVTVIGLGTLTNSVAEEA